MDREVINLINSLHHRENDFFHVFGNLQSYSTDYPSFHFPGYAPVTVITILDKLKTEKEKEEVFDKASMVTGSSSERTYFIANYTHENTEQSNEVDLLALEILDSLMLFAEKFILVRKQREKFDGQRSYG